MIKLAIVIPYYKIDFFEDCIKSISSQTNKYFKVYIGNDASPVDPIPIIEKYLNPYQYKYYDYKDNFGGKNLALQWARVLEQVSEEWFQILGDDDSIGENFVEEFYKNLPNLNEEVNVLKINNCLKFINGSEQRFYEGFSTGLYNSFDLIRRKLAGGLNSSLSEHIFRTRTYHEVGFDIFPLGWHTDDLFLIKMSDFKDLYFIRESEVVIRVFENSTSGSKVNLKEKIEATKKFLKIFSGLLIERSLGWSKEKQFLNAIKRYSSEIGKESLKTIFHYFGVRGWVFYLEYQIGILLKSIVPELLLRIITKNR